MTHEELTSLREKIDGSPGLLSFEKNLTAELMSLEERAGYGFDPLTILFIISVVLQVINICLRDRTQADLELDMVNANVLPPRKLMRLKRRLNVLWAKHCEAHGLEQGKTNPFFSAVAQSVKRANRQEIASIIQASN